MDHLKMFITALVCVTMTGGYVIYERNSHKPVRTFFDNIQTYCKQAGIYRQTINYNEICDNIEKVSKLFRIDRNLLISIAIVESELNINAYNKNKNGTIDKGLLQINTIWDGIAFNSCSNDIMLEPYYACYAGAYILKYYLDKYKGNIFVAIHAYNGITKDNLYYPKKVLSIYYQLNKICNEVE